MTLTRIDVDDKRWDTVVRSMQGHNNYHSAAYHRLATRMDGGSAELLFFEADSYRAALPLITREIDSQLLPRSGILRDATSVYGYPGILSNTNEYPPEFILQFQQALRLELEREKVVSVFMRLGVFYNALKLIEGLGRLEKTGDTIAIDLTIPDDVRFKNYRRNHRTDIKRLRSLGATTSADPDFEKLVDFENAYESNMKRVGAHPWFHFGLSYFQEICTQLKDDVELLITTVDGTMVSAGLFFCTDEIAYAHLIATDPEWVGKSTTKVLFDDAATYFRSRGVKVLHLGGGLGAGRDSLYRYKCGFSDWHVPFHTWKFVVDPQAYGDLCHAHGEAVIEEIGSTSYFPQYRRVRMPSAHQLSE